MGYERFGRDESADERLLSNGAREISLELSRRNEAARLPLGAWTELTSDGRRVLIRTRRPDEVLAALCNSGADLAGIEVWRAR